MLRYVFDRRLSADDAIRAIMLKKTLAGPSCAIFARSGDIDEDRRRNSARVRFGPVLVRDVIRAIMAGKQL